MLRLQNKRVSRGIKLARTADKVPVKHRKETFDWKVTFLPQKTSNVCQQLCSLLKEKQTGFQETFTTDMDVITAYLGEATLGCSQGFPFPGQALAQEFSSARSRA